MLTRSAANSSPAISVFTPFRVSHLIGGKTTLRSVKYSVVERLSNQLPVRRTRQITFDEQSIALVIGTHTADSPRRTHNVVDVRRDA
jgi:hypothetical protein